MSRTNTLSLDECFDEFVSREQLAETDKWYCSKCEEHVRAYKKFDLYTMPEILVVHLKRFKYGTLHMCCPPLQVAHGHCAALVLVSEQVLWPPRLDLP